MLDIELVRLWLPIALSAATFSFLLYDRRRAAWRSELAPIERRLSEVEGDTVRVEETARDALRKVDQLERDMQHLPTKDQVQNLQLKVTELAGDMKAQNETLKAVSATSSRVETYLLTGRAA